MKILLDTREFLWLVTGDPKWSATVAAAVRDPQNKVYLSVVSFWEISLKYALGKLLLTNVLPDALPDISKQMDFETLNVDENTASTFYKLPRGLHKGVECP